MREIAEHIVGALNAGVDTVLVTVADGKGSTPRHGGSQMLVSADGLVCGTIGGGAVEGHAISEARAQVGGKLCWLENLALRKDLNMACGGRASLLYTPVCSNDEDWRAVAQGLLHCLDERRDARLLLKCREDGASTESSVVLARADGTFVGGSGDAEGLAPASVREAGFCNDWLVLPVAVPVRAIVFGGGHVGRATIDALSRVGFSCTLFDCRPEFADPERFPLAHEVICGDYRDISASLKLCERDFVLIVTSGHESDFAVLEQAMRQPLAYVGMIGSRRKVTEGRERMLKAGISEKALNDLHAPIGLDIMAETPEEIAVSIAAECILQRARG